MLKKLISVSIVASLALVSLQANELRKTIQVNDNNLSSSNSFVIGDTKIYFKGDDGDTYGNELWVSDGTDEGTHIIGDFNEGNYDSSHYPLTVLGDTLIFRDGSSNLLYSNGTQSTTGYLDHNASSDSKVRMYSYSDHAVLNDKLLFTRYNVSSTGYELWSTDGTTTTLVKDIYEGSGSSTPSDFKVVGDRVLFKARGTDGNYAIWSTDGTSTGTVKVIAYDNSSYSYQVYFLGKNDNIAYYYTYDRDSYSDPYTYRLWKTDGTTTGTVQVFSSTSDKASVQPDTNINSVAVTKSGNIYFRAEYKELKNTLEGDVWQSNGYELWFSDGTTTGTKLVKDLEVGQSSSNISYFKAVGEKVIFRNSNDSNYKMWVSDGTADGTKELLTKDGKSLYTYYYYYNTSKQYMSDEINGKVYFYNTTQNSEKGYELYVTDGTQTGTYMVKDIYPGSSSSNPQHFTNFNGETYFTATSGDYGLELWKTDGTALGTQMVHDIQYGNDYNDFTLVGQMGDKLYLNVRNDSNYKYNFWSTDGAITLDENRLQDMNVSEAIVQTKAMCKSNPSSCGIETVAPAITSSEVDAKGAGWHLMGTSLPVTDMAPFANTDTVWKWNGTVWEVYSPEPLMQSAIEDAGIAPLRSLDSFDGVWIRNK